MNHLVHTQPLSDKGVRRLARRLHPESIEGLCLVVTADHMGRPPKPAAAPESVECLMEMAKELSVYEEAPQPILKGRHLLAKGMSPGRGMGRILDAALEAQLEGEFTDMEGAEEWLDRYLH